MSLGMTALRLAAVEALRSHPVVAARCPDRVFDSRIADFESDEPVPTIVVTTETLSGETWNPQNGGAPFNDHCDLAIEIAMTQHVVIDDEPMIFRPETDKEQEAALNLLAFCAEWILTTGRPHPRARQQTAAGRVLNKVVTRRVSKRDGERFASDQTGEKLAIHLITFRVEMKGEDIDWSKPAPTGLYAALPDPLRTVAASMPAGGSGEQTCQLIAAELVAALGSEVPPAPAPAPALPDPIPGTLPVTLDLPVTDDSSCACT